MPVEIVIAIAVACFVAIFATNDGKWKKFNSKGEEVQDSDSNDS